MAPAATKGAETPEAPPGSPTGSTTPPATPAKPPAPSSAGTATVTSNTFTGAYVATDALVVIEKRPSKSTPNTFVNEIEIYIVDKAAQDGLCAQLQRNERPAGARRLKIELEKRGGSPAAAALAPGTFPLFSKAVASPTVESELEASTYGASASGGCSEGDFVDFGTNTAAQIIKNDLVITSLTDSGVKGSFELRFTDGKFLQGTFDAPTCDVSAAPSGNTTCK